MPALNERKVLFIDDEADLWIGRFRSYLAEFGLRFVEEVDASRALKRIAEERPDVVLLDILFPGEDQRMEAKGRSLLTAIKEKFPNLPVVMITSTLADATFGVDEQDFATAHFLFSKDRFAEEGTSNPYAELAQQLLAAISEAGDERSFDERLGFVVGETPRMKEVANSTVRAAGTDSTVLVGGESGTGKELVARALHQMSARNKGPFVPVNCGALTAEVLESQLFGHQRGAFTGAVRDHKGYFEQAHCGSLFLDEIDAMSAHLQEKLLRVVEDRRVRRMGSQSEIEVDVRFIVATNKRLPDLVEQERFRRDLYYRLRVVDIELPPLRDRLADLPRLYRSLVQKLNKRLGKRVAVEPRQDVIEKLREHTWPGNIRELQNVLERAIVTSRANVLTPSAIRFEETTEPSDSLAPISGFVQQTLDRKLDWKRLKELRGETRHVILEELIAALERRQGKTPSSAQLAELLRTSPGNMRRILSEADVRLRRDELGDK